MICPVCNSAMRDWTTGKGKQFLVCNNYPKCDTCGTIQTIAALSDAKLDAQQAEDRYGGVQERYVMLSDRFQEMLNGSRPEHVPLPIRLGDKVKGHGSFIETVAKVAITRSRKKQERTHGEQVRLEADAEP